MGYLATMTETRPARRPAPKARRVRKDGWTVEAQLTFVTVLAETGSVRAAAAAVGLHVSTAYKLRSEARGWEFARAWDVAIDQGYHNLRQIAFERALNGVEKPVYYKGERVDTRVVHNDRLLMFLIAHTAKRPMQGPTDYARAMVSLAAARVDHTAVEKAAFAEIEAKLDAYAERAHRAAAEAAEGPAYTAATMPSRASQ